MKVKHIQHTLQCDLGTPSTVSWGRQCFYLRKDFLEATGGSGG